MESVVRQEGLLKRKLIKLCGGLTKKEYINLYKMYTEAKDKYEDDITKLRAENMALKRSKAELGIRINNYNNTSYNQEIGAVYIDYGAVTINRSNINGVQYYKESEEAPFGCVEIRFYNDSKIEHILAFYKNNVYSVNGVDYDYSKVEEMADKIADLVNDKQDVIIERVKW